MKKLIIGSVLLVILAVISIFGINMYISNFSAAYMNSSIPIVDAVLIPGAKVSGETVSYVLASRLDCGLDIYKNGYAKKIIVSGDHGSTTYDEVNAMRNYLMDRGVLREDIFMDHAGFDTYASIYRAKEVFCVKSLIVTSQTYHNERAIFIGRKLGVETYGVSAHDVYVDPYRVVREPLSRIKATACVIFKPKPKYLGDVMPVWGDGSVTDDGKS